MKRILIYPYQLWAWLVFAPYLGLSTLFFAILSLVIAPMAGPRVAGKYCGGLWSRLICYMTPVFVTTQGKENIDRNQSYIIVANHQSVYDIVALYGWLGVDFRWVMKKELRKVPFLGFACEALGHIFIDRSNTKKALESLESAQKIIVNGTSVILFPEGTRSKTGELGKFKKGAFKMACDLGLPVLPVTIHGTREIVQTKSLMLFPGKAKLVIHSPIVSANKSDTALMEETRQIMYEALNSDILTNK